MQVFCSLMTFNSDKEMENNCCNIKLCLYYTEKRGYLTHFKKNYGKHFSKKSN